MSPSSGRAGRANRPVFEPSITWSRRASGEIRLLGTRTGRTSARFWAAMASRLMSDTELSPQRARIGMVFQLFHLWPHHDRSCRMWPCSPEKWAGMSQAKASRLGVRNAGQGSSEARKLTSIPTSLSGGQQQRVAIARVARPESRSCILI